MQETPSSSKLGRFLREGQGYGDQYTRLIILHLPRQPTHLQVLLRLLQLPLERGYPLHVLLQLVDPALQHLLGLEIPGQRLQVLGQLAPRLLSLCTVPLQFMLLRCTCLPVDSTTTALSRKSSGLHHHCKRGPHLLQLRIDHAHAFDLFTRLISCRRITGPSVLCIRSAGFTRLCAPP